MTSLANLEQRLEKVEQYQQEEFIRGLNLMAAIAVMTSEIRGLRDVGGPARGRRGDRRGRTRSLQCLRPSTACGRSYRRQGGRDTPRLSGTARGPSTAHSFQL